MKPLFTIAALLLASSASAATITESRLVGGQALPVSASDFTVSGAVGNGGSVVQNPNVGVIFKTPDATSYGRFNASDPATGAWLDTQDWPELVWNISSSTAFTQLGVAITDAHDQANSFFRFRIDGATWSIDKREPNGTLHWLTILFDEPVSDVTAFLSTRHNDGAGLSDFTIMPETAPIPLPPALALMLGGFAALFAASRQRA